LSRLRVGLSDGPAGSGWRSEESMSGQAGLFDVDDRLKRLSDLGDQLVAFAAAVDFEVFRPELDVKS
jgi:hypothetical protein